MQGHSELFIMMGQEFVIDLRRVDAESVSASASELD